MMLWSKVFPNSYRDSVLLMKMAGTIRKMDGIQNAEVMIATDANKEILKFNGLLTDEISAATPNDLVVSVYADGEENAKNAIEKAQELIFEGVDSKAAGPGLATSVENVRAALSLSPSANLALISIPGPLVKKEAMHLLDKGVNLMIFSDNVPVEEELEIKRKAAEKDLLVMGPDCGTAILNGVALCFANVVRRGNIGMVCAAGTGLQEVSCIISNMGGGISNAIGTGSNDVSDYIGGITLKQGLRWLERDSRTDIIVVICKPSGDRVLQESLEEFKKCRKPLVVNFIGRREIGGQDGSTYFAHTLEETACKALELAGSQAKPLDENTPEIREYIRKEARLICEGWKGKKYLRGLYTGGTLAAEADVICRDKLASVYSNMRIPGCEMLADPTKSTDNTVIDLADDFFTLGKPHAMIDPETKNLRMLEESRDPEASVFLLDFVLGYGINEDPVGNTLDYIRQSRENAAREDRHISFVASVTGTDEDPQQRRKQVKMLEDAGVFVLPTNAAAVRVAAEIILACEGEENHE